MLWRCFIDRFGPWEVRTLRCYEIGKELTHYQPAPPEAHPLAFDWRLAVTTELLVAATCHRTNWDHLRATFLDLASRGRIEVSELADLEPDAFAKEFATAYTARGDLRARLGILREVSSTLVDRSPISWWIDRNRSGARSDASGLYEALAAIPTFNADRHSKKVRILVQQLARTGLLRLDSDADIHPAIEYHVLRLYIRTGRVTNVHGPSWDDTRAVSVSSIDKLRSAVEQAMRITAAAADLDLLDVNEAEWQVARSYCVANEARCFGPPLPAKPVERVIAELRGNACPFVEVCDGPHEQRFRTINAPRLASKHAFY